MSVFTHVSLLPYRRGLVEIPDERWLYIHSSKFGTLYKFVHSRRGLVEIPNECWSYFHHPDELGAHSGTLHLLPGREHAPHYYYAKDLLPELDLGWGRSFL